jgi:phage tail sheath protein FI|tara:strand:+ start:3453 stop:5867 length:2415 start_codon:yes stop_codon:yes gene_type:complete
MAEKIVSPGVFTNEKDLSFLPAGIAAIGAAIVGPTKKGPAFVPTIVEDFDEFIAKFGGLSESTYVPYAVKSYLNAASTVTIVRVMQEGGYDAKAVHIIASGSYGKLLVGSIFPTKNTANGASTGNGFETSSFPATANQAVSVTASVNFTLSGSGVTAQALTASANPNNVSSFKNVLGESPQGAKKGYVYHYYDNFLKSDLGTGSAVYFETGSTNALVNYSASTAGDPQPACTPYITSQIIGGAKLDLFKVKTIADGTDTNTSLKVSIINTVLPGGNPASDYGSFTLLVREYGDTDKRPVVLESFANLNLDPDSPNYISRRIGDKYKSVTDAGIVTTNGDYDNISQYVYIDAVDDVKNKAIAAAVKPFGFDAYVAPVGVTAGITATVPTASYIIQDTEINSAYNKKAYYGHNFASTSDMSQLLKPLSHNASALSNNDFNLDECFVHPSASAVDGNSTIVGGASISGSTFAGVDISNILKFSVGLQGGFDGDDPALEKKTGANISSTNLFGMDCSSASAKGAAAYIKALNTINNPDELDVNLIVTPGATIADHSAITNKAIEVAEDRSDCFALLDCVVQGSTIGAAVSAVANGSLDTNYAGVYWPWVKILDTDRNKPVWVPPSVVIPRVYANSDNVAYEWFAPAGLNRGGISEAIDIEKKLQQSDRDDLYDNRINPIATFPNQGVCVWGQKTLQAKPSALDRVNVRRLLIALKKFIASSSRFLVFENNTTETRQRFLNIVTPYLETVKSRQGLFAYRVVMDETNNTPDIIDRNQMFGQIFIQPAKAAEFIVLDFNVLPTGATFDNA